MNKPQIPNKPCRYFFYYYELTYSPTSYPAVVDLCATYEPGIDAWLISKTGEKGCLRPVIDILFGWGNIINNVDWNKYYDNYKEADLVRLTVFKNLLKTYANSNT